MKTKSHYRPQIYIKEAHQAGEITCVKFMKDEKRIATRSMDDTLKLWDIRNT
jgi:WD40 repeat protein